MPSISGLVTNSALTPVENNLLDVSSLVKKNYHDCHEKISEIEKKSPIIIMINTLLLRNLIS